MKKILLIRFSALGDVAMLSPVVRLLAERHPELEVTVLSRPFCEPLFGGMTGNVRFMGRDIKNDYKGLRGLFRLFRELDREGFDCIMDMHDVLRTKVLRKLFRLHGYRVYKINKRRELRKVITAQGSRKQLRQLPTSFENYAEVIRKAGLGDVLDVLDVLCNAIAEKAEKEGAEKEGAEKEGVEKEGVKKEGVKKEGVKKEGAEGKGARLIGIAPFAAHQGKIYPIERMEKVIALLGECKRNAVKDSYETLRYENENKVNVILFGGGGDERAKMQEWADKYPHVHLASEYCKNLSEELELMSRLDVMVSMDSANMHLASLVGTRVVSIWGATHPFAGFLGWGQRMDDCIQRDDLACRPCSIYGNRPCLRGDLACMDIAPSLIIERLKIEN